jgi:ubiquinol-cytochrome c reductase cytochrome b subunit
MKTLLNAGKTSKLELRYLLSNHAFGGVSGAALKPLDSICWRKGLIKNNVKILNSRSQSAGVCGYPNEINSLGLKSTSNRRFHSTASQRLHAKDQAWFVGFVEGDGWFSIAKNGNYCKYEFGIELAQRDIKLLYKIKKFLGVGIIDIRKDNSSAIFRIRSKTSLANIIFPIFDTYPMFTAKHWDYINFRNNMLENVRLYKNLKHYIRSDHSPFKSTYDILSSSYFNNWLVGFIEAEGCFYSKDNTVSFDITQKNGLQIIEAIKTYLSINLYTDKTDCLKTTSLKGIQNIINFLNKTDAKLKGYKRLQYLIALRELRVNDRYKTLDIPTRYAKGTFAECLIKI